MMMMLLLLSRLSGRFEATTEQSGVTFCHSLSLYATITLYILEFIFVCNIETRLFVNKINRITLTNNCNNNSNNNSNNNNNNNNDDDDDNNNSSNNNNNNNNSNNNN